VELLETVLYQARSSRCVGAQVTIGTCLGQQG
jgi:hypothetical protein